MNPYLILNLPPSVSDTEIRDAYLQLANRYTPTQAPAEFAQIARAYALIDTPEKRLELELHGKPTEGDSGNLTQKSLKHLRLHRPRPQWTTLCQTFGQNA